jgi:hypothetical protein
MSASRSAHQGKIGRIVGLSLAALWLVVSMMAAIAQSPTTEAGSTVTAVEGPEIVATVIAVNN